MSILVRSRAAVTLYRINMIFRFLLIMLCASVLSGCAAFISSATIDLADNLSQAILNNDDLATVEAGAPAYLLMVDGLLGSNPNSESLLREAAVMYNSYASVFVKDKMRAKRLTDKGLRYAFRAVCVNRKECYSLREMSYQEFCQIINNMGSKNIPTLYALGTAWTGWIQAHSDDWNAVAEISRVEMVIKKVIELDEYYRDGEAHLYLGAFATLLPPAMGGKPEVGRYHFERALEISGNKNLMIKVAYARHYARLVFDRKLHDRLLQEAIIAEPDVPGYTLTNIMAQQQARELLKSADEYF